MGRNPGILSIFNNVAPGRDGDFNRWFQSEHLEERLSVPGFLLGRRYQAVAADRQFFNYYLTESADVLASDAYLARVNDPTPMTRMVMSEIFRDMIRTVCERVFAAGDVRGNAAIVTRFHEPPDYPRMQSTISEMLADKTAVWGEIWTAAKAELPASREERLRGGDARIEACLLIETAHEPEAVRVLELVKERFPQAAAGTYRLLCDIRSDKGEFAG